MEKTAKEMKSDDFRRKKDFPQQPESIDIQKLAMALLRRWWAIALCFLIGAGAAWGRTVYMTVPTYTTNALIIVNMSKVSLGNTGITLGDFNSSVQLGNRYTVAITSRRVLEKAIAEYDLPYSYGQLRGMVSVRSVNDTEFLSISATATDPVAAAKAANAVTASLIEIMNTLVEGNNALVLDKAPIPTVSNGPNLQRNVMMGGVVGAALCCGVLALLFLLDNTIKDTEELYSLYRYAVLSSIPDHADTGYQNRYGYSYSKKKPGDSQKKPKKTAKKNNVFCGWEDISFARREAYNLLRTNVEFSFAKEEASDRGRLIGITSSVPNEFKSTTATNLALSLAEEGRKVLLLDCDLRKTELRPRLELEEKRGLSDYLVSALPLQELIQHGVYSPKLDVLLGGTFPPNPSKLLASQRMKELAEKLAEEYEFVIVDLPPLLEVSDALVAGRFCDGMLMVIRRNFAVKRDVEQSFREIEYAGIRMLGLVMTGSEEHTGMYKYKKRYGYRYGYGYGYGQKPEHPDKA